MCDNYGRLFSGSPIYNKYRQLLETSNTPEIDVLAAVH